MGLNHYQKHFKKVYHYPLRVDIPKQSPTTCGVYFITKIFLGEEIIVYIGSSKLLRMRVIFHPIIKKLKKNNSFGFLYVIPLRENIKEVLSLERYFIESIKPELNIHGVIKKSKY